MPLFPAVVQTVFNVKTYGATGNGTTDDTTDLQNAINAAGGTGNAATVWFPAGTYAISVPLVVPSNVRLVGEGRNVSIIQSLAGFVGAAHLTLTSVSYVRIRDLTIQGPTSTYSGNPAADGIDLTGCTDCMFENIELYYMNGWGINSTGTSSTGNQKIVCRDVVPHSCAQGFQVLGVSGSSNVGLHQFTRCRASGIQNGDGWLIQDIHDVQLTDCGGEITAGSGYTLHLKGVVGAIFIENGDFGPASVVTTPTCFIESSTSGNPKSVDIRGGIYEGGSAGITVAAGSNVKVIGSRLYNNGTYGINISGGDVMILGCDFSANGASGTTGRYDLRNNGTGHVLAANCVFNTPQGATSGQTNAAVHDPGGTMVLLNPYFYGAGYTISNWYNTKPSIVEGIQGLGASGNNIAAPSVPATGVASTTKPEDYDVYITAGTSTCTVAIGGTTAATLAASAVMHLYVPANQTVTLTYSNAPTWTWFRH